MADNELERIYTIPLRKVKAGSRNGRTDRAVRQVRAFLTQHMKSEDIWIDDAVNRAIWARGKYNVPSKLRVRAVKFDDGVVEVSLPEEDAMTSIRAALKEERESKAPILPTPEAEGDEEEEESETAEIEAEPEEKETAEIEAEPEGPEAEPEAEGESGSETKTKGSAPEADEEGGKKESS
jgi:large subunit ribosomal protein L31e